MNSIWCISIPNSIYLTSIWRDYICCSCDKISQSTKKIVKLELQGISELHHQPHKSSPLFQSLETMIIALVNLQLRSDILVICKNVFSCPGGKMFHLCNPFPWWWLYLILFQMSLTTIPISNNNQNSRFCEKLVVVYRHKI